MATKIGAMSEDEIQRALKQATSVGGTEMSFAVKPERPNDMSAATSSGTTSKNCVHELFEAQAERTPDAIAIQCEKQSLTYVQLNVRANQDRSLAAEARCKT